jgi:hypothetical protein
VKPGERLTPVLWSGSAIHGIAKPLYLFIFTQFRTEKPLRTFPGIALALQLHF